MLVAVVAQTGHESPNPKIQDFFTQ